MKQTKGKRSDYLEQAVKQAADIVYQAEDKNEAAARLKDLFSRKLLESFKNGIAVGLKKAGKVE